MAKTHKVTRRRKRRTTAAAKSRSVEPAVSAPWGAPGEPTQTASEPSTDPGRLWALLDALVDLFRQVVAGIQEPKRATAAATVARAAAALLNALEPKRRVELLFKTPEWRQLEQALAEALAPYPRARDAVSAVLRRLAREGES